MDIYSSDLKLSQLSMTNLGRQQHGGYSNYNRQPHQSILHQTSTESIASSSLASDSSLLFDNGSSFAIVDVLDFLDNGLHDSSKAFDDGFTQNATSDINNQWLEFLNPPPSEKKKINETGGGGDDDARISFTENPPYLVDDGWEFLDNNNNTDDDENNSNNCNGDDDDNDGRVKVLEYALYKDSGDDDDDNMEFKFQYDRDIFQEDEMDQLTFQDDLQELNPSARKIAEELLFAESQGLGQRRETSDPLDNSNSMNYDCVSYLTRQNIGNGKRSSGTSLEFNRPPVMRVKLEPSEEMTQDEAMYYGNILNGTESSKGLPPTPPSSGCGVNSDSECSNGELMSGPPSPPITTREVKKEGHKHNTSLFSLPIPSSGILILSEEEKRTLIAEGYHLPSKLPLTKQEEKNLKKIRRKIKNKISAQESRRKKKEYLESLEKKVEHMANENANLKKRINLLESNNRSLTSELQRLQGLANKVMKSSSPSSIVKTNSVIVK